MPLPSTQALILDDSDHEAPIGQVGEICLRGPQVMAGYWKRLDETAKVFTADGWWRTGDMGIVDARGYFWITDGKKDMIVVVRKDPSPAEGDLLAHSRRHLTGYKVHRSVEFRDQPLPRTNRGKVMRRALRQTSAVAAVAEAAPASGQVTTS